MGSTLCEKLIGARASNLAMRQTDWPNGRYVYHGIGNVLRFADNDEPLKITIATLTADNWICVDAPFCNSGERPIPIEINGTATEERLLMSTESSTAVMPCSRLAIAQNILAAMIISRPNTDEPMCYIVDRAIATADMLIRHEQNKR